MGSFLSKILGRNQNSPSNKTITKLSTLQTDIQKLEKKRTDVKASQKVLLTRMMYSACSLTLTYAILAYTLLPTLLIAWLDTEYWLQFIILWLPVIIIPLFYIFAKKSAVKWYNWRINRWDRKLKVKRKSKLEILDNVMEVETYNNAMKIFEMFDKSRLSGAPKLPRRATTTESGVRQRTTNNVHPLVSGSSSVKYHSFGKTEPAKSGLDKDSIRNMAMNYTFSGKSASSTVKSDRLNTSMVSPRYSGDKTTKVVEEPSSGDNTDVQVTKVKKIRNLGPATPSLDESALKALTKGLVGKKKKIKKKVSEKEVSEKKSEKSTSVTGMTTSTDTLMEKSMESVLEENAPLIEDNTSTVEFMSPKSELREAKSRIQELQEEIERLRAAEDEQNNSITVVGKLPNKAMTRSASTNSSRANIILRAKKIEKHHAKHTTSKLVTEKKMKKSATNESNLSGLLELPGSDDENTDGNKTKQTEEAHNNTITLNSQISQNSLMTDQSEAEQDDITENERNEQNEQNGQNTNGTVVQEEMTDDDEVISENDEGRGNSNGDNSLENVENSQTLQNNAEISDDELLESGDDEKMVLPQSPQPDVELSS